MRLALLLAVVCALVAAVASEGFLWLVHVSQKPNDPYVPNWAGVTMKAALGGAVTGAIATWIASRIKQ